MSQSSFFFGINLISLKRWLAVRIEMIGNLIYVSIALLFCFTRGNFEAGVVGLALMYGSSVTGNMNWFVRTFTMLETNMNRVTSFFSNLIFPSFFSSSRLRGS